MARLVDQICAYAEKLSYSGLPETVVRRTKELILDSVGCALGGASSPPARIVQAIASESPSSLGATVMVTGTRTSPDVAAFANGIATRYLDYNDTYLGGGHPSDMLASVLASNDAVHADGKAVIAGTVLGYEVFCGTRDSVEAQYRKMDRRPYGNQTAFGPFGVTAVAAKAFGLSREQTVHALNLAAVSHFPPSGGGSQLSHWKACHLAMASRAGVFSAMLARKGLTAPSAALDPDCGYFQAIGVPVEFEPYDMGSGAFRIMRSHVKAFPCGFHGMGPATVASQLHPEVIEDLDSIREVRIHATRISAQLMASSESKWKPETRETADHSIPFVTAMCLMEGSLQIRHFDEGYYLRPDVRDFMSKIRVLTPDTFEASFHDVPSVKIEVELASGDVRSAEVLRPMGHPENPMTPADYERKFRALAAPVLSEAQTNALLDRLWHLEEVKDIGEVLALTVPGP
jgi:2-methylcitrate dehydratase